MFANNKSPLSLFSSNLTTYRDLFTSSIRCQLSNIGSTIKGDLKYGAKRSNKDGSIHLHARRIEFTHPVSKENIVVIAPTPDDTICKACE